MTATRNCYIRITVATCSAAVHGCQRERGWRSGPGRGAGEVLAEERQQPAVGLDPRLRRAEAVGIVRKRFELDRITTRLERLDQLDRLLIGRAAVALAVHHQERQRLRDAIEVLDRRRVI